MLCNMDAAMSDSMVLLEPFQSGAVMGWYVFLHPFVVIADTAKFIF